MGLYSKTRRRLSTSTGRGFRGLGSEPPAFLRHPNAEFKGHGRRFWLLAISGLLTNLLVAPASGFQNRYLKKVPPKHADYKRDVIDKQVALMQKRGIWAKPSK